LAQQLATTDEVAASLAAEKRLEVDATGTGFQNGGHTGHHQGNPHPHTTRLMIGHTRKEEEGPLHHAALPKLSFPKFNGENPRIWIDKCGDYFHIFNIPESMWTTTTSLHLEENAVKWWQVFRLKHGLFTWPVFVAAIEERFGVYDQIGWVSRRVHKVLPGYAVSGSHIQPCFDEMFFTAQYVNGLKEELRSVVQTHLPDTVDQAALLAKMQQQSIDRNKTKYQKWNSSKNTTTKADTQQQNISPLWKERQLRDFRKANGPCYYCGEKFSPGHLQKCIKRNKPQINVIVSMTWMLRSLRIH
jgi:hypothetical protein